jgi:hypothetical protein
MGEVAIIISFSLELLHLSGEKHTFLGGIDFCDILVEKHENKFIIKKYIFTLLNIYIFTINIKGELKEDIIAI